MTKNSTHMVVYYDTAFARVNVTQCASAADPPFITDSPGLLPGTPMRVCVLGRGTGSNVASAVSDSTVSAPVANQTKASLTLLANWYYPEYDECDEVQVRLLPFRSRMLAIRP